MFERAIKLLRNAWETPDLRRKILFSVLILTIYRVLAHVPLPSINLDAMRQLFQQSQFLGLLNIFSGGALSNASIIALGLNPYITSSIIFQLAGMVVPQLSALQKEGEQGQRKINQYTRLLAVPLAVVQSLSVYFILRQPLGSGLDPIVPSLQPLPLIVLILSLAAGSILLMWLGELLTEYGIGNGISILISVGIISGIPKTVSQLAGAQTGDNLTDVLVFLVIALLVIAGIVFMNEATRQIPVQYARRYKGQNTAAVGQTTYIPLRLNQAGVIPIIFAVSLMLIPGTVANFALGLSNPQIVSIAQTISVWFSPTSISYAVMYFLLVVAFTFFYTAVTFNPERIAENLQKQGGFIPGVRPGAATIEYLNRLLTRLTVPGSLFLGAIAVMPILVQFAFPSLGSVVSLGGTSILIVVAVTVETVRTMESMMVMRGYDKFAS